MVSPWPGIATSCSMGADSYDRRTEIIACALGAAPGRRATCNRRHLPSPDLNCHLTLPVGVHATEGTISYLDMLRCGISNRPMSARDQTRTLRARLVRVR